MQKLEKQKEKEQKQKEKQVMRTDDALKIIFINIPLCMQLCKFKFHFYMPDFWKFREDRLSRKNNQRAMRPAFHLFFSQITLEALKITLFSTNELTEPILSDKIGYKLALIGKFNQYCVDVYIKIDYIMS